MKESKNGKSYARITKLVKARIYVVPFGTINAIEATISLALA